MKTNKQTKIEKQLKKLSRKPDSNWQKRALNELLIEINSTQNSNFENKKKTKLVRFWNFIFQSKQLAFLTMMLSFLVITSIVFFPLTKTEDKPIFDKFIDTCDGIDEDHENDDLKTKPLQSPTKKDETKEKMDTIRPTKEPIETYETENITLSPTRKALPQADEKQITATPEPTYPALDGGGELTVEAMKVCILNEDNEEETITIESNELEEYLQKGAIQGPCPTLTPTECLSNNCN